MAQVTYKKMKIKGSPIIVDAAIRDDKGRIISDRLDSATPMVIDTSSSPIDLVEYKDKWVKLKFTSPDTLNSISINNAHLPRKIEIIADIGAEGITEFNLVGIDVDDKLLKKSTSPLAVSGSGTLNIKTGTGITKQSLVFVLEKTVSDDTVPTFREYFYYSDGDGAI